jgi:hypothetical protein
LWRVCMIWYCNAHKRGGETISFLCSFC